jgi:hypothetical protein
MNKREQPGDSSDEMCIALFTADSTLQIGARRVSHSTIWLCVYQPWHIRARGRRQELM